MRRGEKRYRQFAAQLVGIGLRSSRKQITPHIAQLPFDLWPPPSKQMPTIAQVLQGVGLAAQADMVANTAFAGEVNGFPGRTQLEAQVDILTAIDESFIESAHRLEIRLAQQHAGPGDSQGFDMGLVG